MVSKNGSKLKFSVESLLEPSVTTAAPTLCYPETADSIISPVNISFAGPGGYGILKLKMDHATQGIENQDIPHYVISHFLSLEVVQTETTNNGEPIPTPDGSQPKKGRMRFSQEQIQALEKRFQQQHYLVPADRKILAFALRMSERQVKTWFQNRRAQYKRSKPLVRCPQLHHMKPTYRFTMDSLIPATPGAFSHWNCALQQIATCGKPPTSMSTPYK